MEMKQSEMMQNQLLEQEELNNEYLAIEQDMDHQGKFGPQNQHLNSEEFFRTACLNGNDYAF
jgi:hypothetical protein